MQPLKIHNEQLLSQNRNIEKLYAITDSNILL